MANRMMQRVRMCGVALLAGGMIGIAALPAAAGGVGAGPMPETNPNAALHYWRAWSQVDDAVLTRIGELWKLEGREASDEAALAELVEEQEAAGVVDALMRASKRPVCDFGTEFEEGIEALLPHLTFARGGAILLVASAEAHLEEGDLDGAAERLAAVLQTAKHVSTDRTLISSLVGMAIFALAEGEIREVAEGKGWSDSQRALLTVALDRLEGGDPFRTRESIRMEGEMMVRWIRNAVADAESPEEFVEVVSEWVTGNDDMPLEIAALAKTGDLGSAVRGDTALLAQFYDLVYEAWDDEDAGEKIEVLRQQVIAGRFGRLATIFVPAFEKVRERSLDAQGRIEGLRGLLEG